MALLCPRCGTDVPVEAMYCPYCSLPKPKRGFVAPTEQAQPTPPEAPKMRAVKRAKTPNIKAPKRATPRPIKPRGSRGVRVLGVSALVAILGVGLYIFVVPMVYSEHAEPKKVLDALDKLRRSPSNEPGVNIDARLTRELETQRRVGNLVAYQGWVFRPIEGTKSKIILAYSFEEVGNTVQNAEWIADLVAGTFTPQTELAVKVSSQ